MSAAYGARYMTSYRQHRSSLTANTEETPSVPARCAKYMTTSNASGESASDAGHETWRPIGGFVVQ